MSQNRLSQKGMSLIEIMIAMMISVIVIFEVYKIYQTNIQSFKQQKAVAELQRNARFSIDMIKNSVHSTGYARLFGSISSRVENLLKVKDDIRWDIKYAIIGYNNVSNSDTYAGITGFKSGSDVIIIKQATRAEAILDNPDANTIHVASGSETSAGDLLLLTNSNTATLVQASSVVAGADKKIITVDANGTPGNDSGLTIDYSYNSDISSLRSLVYYLKPDASSSNVSATLYRAVIDSSGALEEEEIASNILDFQIAYGLDTDADNQTDEYKNASDITDWGQVSSLGLFFVAASESIIQSNLKTVISFDASEHQHNIDVSTDAGADKRMKRAFRTYIDLKNRLI